MLQPPAGRASATKCCSSGAARGFLSGIVAQGLQRRSVVECVEANASCERDEAEEYAAADKQGCRTGVREPINRKRSEQGQARIFGSFGKPP